MPSKVPKAPIGLPGFYTNPGFVPTLQLSTTLPCAADGLWRCAQGGMIDSNKIQNSSANGCHLGLKTKRLCVVLLFLDYQAFKIDNIWKCFTSYQAYKIPTKN